MAGVEVIASIVGIAGVGVKLAKTLYQVGYRTATAGHNINRIATNVSLFAAMLKHVGTVLDDAHSLHSPEAVETVKQIVKECESVFQEIADIVVLAKDKSESNTKTPQAANGSKRRISMVARAKWYFEGPKAEHLLSQLEYLKTTLSVLLQTLNLAALSAKINATLGESEQPAEIVQQEKLHIETLVVAQQLSVHVMQQTQDKLDAQSTRPSSPTDDSSEARYPKLLTQGSTTSLEMVRLGPNDVEFLERRPSVPAGEDGAMLEPSLSRSESFIEDLLSRWTVSPETKFPQQPTVGGSAQHGAPDRKATPVPFAMRTRQSEEVLHERSVTPVPDVRVKPPLHSSSSSPPPSAPPRHLMSPQSDRATVASVDPVGARSASSLSYYPPSEASTISRISSPRNALERSMTNPEADVGPVLNSFHDHHGLKPPMQRNPSLAPPMALKPRSRGPFHSNALAPYMAGAAAASGNRRLSAGWSNYRQPYVSDDDSTWSPSDSDESPPGSRGGTKTSARTRRDSNVSTASHPKGRRRSSQYNSGNGDDAGDGLDIPWRIRVSPTKYFDFRDNEMVGPRMPFLPTESKAWIYSNDSAHTEISKNWVNEEALVELRYPHTELRGNQDNAGILGDEGGWKILAPLKFHEIDALVNRTIDYVEQATARQQSGRPSPPQIRHPPQSGPPPQAGQPPPQQPLQMPQMPQMPPMHPRNMSYNDSLPPLHPPAGPPPRGAFAQQTMSPRDMHEPPFGSRDRHGRHGGRERDHDAEAYKERKKERHRRREKEREKEREREQNEKKKEKHGKGSGMAGTLAKVGTLAVLLEGLDGAF